MNEIQLERVDFEPGKSFKLFSPRLRNTFLWHYHPEIELVYVQADAGIRHVGTHISTYTQSDLVFIGSNIPHLNFDYRLRSDYHQIVIQLRTDFLGEAISISPEFSAIRQLFKKADQGIAFTGETKAIVGEKLAKLGQLSSYKQLIELVDIFNLLAHASDVEILNTNQSSKDFILKDKIRMGAIYEYIDANYHQKPDVNVVAAKVHLTTAAFCRYFKRQTNMTFTNFVNQYRIERAKNLLMQGNNVTETCYAIGFESLSYFNKLFNKIVGQNPSDFKRNYTGKVL
ncbi:MULTISPECIES: AraC family transcriptional regulator [unclassified Mucilaginibacter]|uniref:helix-turn-helix domain-containing protein n=1 Tax=unclassified Mucilaginibacter TaxID=2617802 RepID=UPI002AC8CE7D|nr:MULTISPECIES: AraC family transcriptional regulator [unclassified Mucilaginibacter]MEB0261391.1 AraC family transcriptional regulator [Mucilaginibacter sp. 10I4]MEB0278850.1 AraC family transcriptional regulator [Mucilaginibacter sp. 10B2]MEB0299784.1 AraC family transcriptional regulator [Mucilaginibacter sp. 5C4]WPX22032.1 AraC family transcriptional regulator [Mucilaginibacter sp. 5C4]